MKRLALAQAALGFGLRKRPASNHLAAICLLACLSVVDAPLAAQSDVPGLQALLELGSNFSSLDSDEQRRVLELIDNRGQRLDLERDILNALDRASPETPYDEVVAAKGSMEADDLEAAQHSFARYLSAEQALDHDNAARQLRAFQQYLAMAADDVEQGLKGDDDALAHMRSEPALLRRPAAEQAAFVATLRSSGLPAKSLEVLHASGATQEQIDSYLQQVLANKPEEIGASAADFFADIENARRAVVERLRALAAASPAALAGPTHQTFLVANPSDRDATVTLRVRRASIPPAWAIAIVNADEPAGQKPKYPVTEAERGRTYTLRLPAHAQTRVAAKVTPVGDMAEDTVASWAVEGSIDGAVIGGMMMQMHVPASIPPVQLPPIRSAVDTSAASSTAAASPSAGGRLGSGSTRVSVFIGGAVLLLVVLAVVLVIRSKKGRGADAAS